MNRTALAALVAVLSCSSTAFADGWGRGGREGHERFEHERFEHGRFDHRWGRPWMNVPAPLPPRLHGHYETRTVPRWVEGRWEQVWVPGVCAWTPYGQQCANGSYQNVWQEGRWLNETQQVWVPCD